MYTVIYFEAGQWIVSRFSTEKAALELYYQVKGHSGVHKLSISKDLILN